LIHSLTFLRPNHLNLHVYGYREEGDLTTPFDMRVKNGIDRFHLASAVLDHVSSIEGSTRPAKEDISRRLAAHGEYIVAHGQDLPEIRDWKWTGVH
jgi:xylulose-5-phosphate/fructose-6-phosphate phosphoketolase